MRRGERVRSYWRSAWEWQSLYPVDLGMRDTGLAGSAHAAAEVQETVLSDASRAPEHCPRMVVYAKVE